MKMNESLKPLIYSLVFGTGSLILFFAAFGMCFWGCSGNEGLAIVLAVFSGVLLIIGIVSFIVWLSKIIKLTTDKKERGELDSQVKNNKRDVLLSIISIFLIIGAVIHVNYLVKVSSIVINSYVIIEGFKVLLSIIAAAGLWFNRRWGVLILILLSIIVAVQMASTFRGIQEALYFFASLALIVFLTVKIRRMN